MHPLIMPGRRAWWNLLARRAIPTLALFLVLLGATWAPASADVPQPLEPLSPPPPAETGQMVDETAKLWFVEMPSLPTADGTSLATVQAEKNAFRAAAQKAGLKYTERFAFDVLWNGLSIKLELSELAKLARLPGVKNLYPVEAIKRPEPVTQDSEPELVTSLAMIGADVVQSELGFTGAGVKVGVIDSGIDYHHPDLGGGFGPGFRVAAGYDFVGDLYNGFNIPVPDPDPDDCMGHGTHVAGIIGANGAVTGVAPEVSFGAYRVFGCAGSTQSDIMLAAMERALADGMQVVNMSIGAAYQWPQYPTAMAATRLVNKGVVVAAAIGNDGVRGLYSASAPGLGEKVIGAASFDNANRPTGGLISYFSSYGLSPDLSLKPDLGAPGGFIYSTYPVEKGSYATLSGTSMSSPHVAGAAALLLQAKPYTPSQAMRGILQNSAEPALWWGGLGFLDNVHRQGAGLLRIDRAILATTKIEPAKIAAGEGAAGPFSQVFTIKNKGAANVTYSLSFDNALSTDGVIVPSFFTSDASVAFSAPSVLVPAGGTASVTATITPASGPTSGQYGGYIVFTPQGGGQKYRVPFAGFVGDYQGIQVLTPTPNNFPWLAKFTGGTFVKQVSGATFTMAGGDVPYILVHLEHQARLLRMEVFQAVSGTAWHRAYNQEYVGRNSLPTSFFAFPWDGQTTSGKKIYTVPDGQYVMKLSILKALGDAANPAHWETWTSPAFTIDRP